MLWLNHIGIVISNLDFVFLIFFFFIKWRYRYSEIEVNHIYLYYLFLQDFIYLLHVWQNDLKRDNRFINSKVIIFEYKLAIDICRKGA